VSDAASRSPAARLRVLPALLLVAVAAIQIPAAKLGVLSPWLGGGFGMFSTTDSPARRHLHAVALRPGLQEELEIPEDLEFEVRKAVGLPTRHRLEAMARSLEIFLRDFGDPDAGPLEAISIGVYRVRFDRGTLAPTGEPVASLRVPASAE
jgi:hypothetical protein